jgi:type I restriction enzyme S subunit
LDNAYLWHWLASAKPALNRRARGSTFKQVTRAAVGSLLIPLPPLAEQRRIAAVLDKADGVRRKRRDSLQLLDEFLRSAFLEMFGDPVRNEKGWEVLPLERIANVQGGLQVTARRASNPKDVPYLRVANVYRDRLDLSEVKKLRVTDDELERTRLQAGDVLVVEGHGNPAEIGRSAVWDGSIDPCVHQNHLIRVRADKAKAEADYLSAFLNSAGGRRQMFGFGKTTSGLNTISTGNVRRVQIMLPPIDLQRRHRQLRSQVLVSGQRIAAALQEKGILFDSLAQRAFQGQL